MRKEIIGRFAVPFGGAFSVVDPLTGITVTGHCFETVLRGVYDERRANSVPIGLDMDSEVEQWICEKYPGECKAGANAVSTQHLTLHHIVAGSKVMLAQWFNGRKVVDRAEAERRAQICVGCPMNVTFSKPCGGLCPELRDVVGAIVGAQGTSLDWQLHSCAVCRCYLQAAIWVEQKTQWDVLDEATQEKFKALNYPCWKRPA